MLKITISAPDHSLPARYREWSGTINFVSSGGGSNGYWLGVDKWVGVGMARGSAREQRSTEIFRVIGKGLGLEGLLKVWENG